MMLVSGGRMLVEHHNGSDCVGGRKCKHEQEDGNQKDTVTINAQVPWRQILRSCQISPAINCVDSPAPCHDAPQTEAKQLATMARARANAWRYSNG
jgi:hypothetical protein